MLFLSFGHAGVVAEEIPKGMPHNISQKSLQKISHEILLDIPLVDRQSTTLGMSPQNQALQNDPLLNPASLWVLEGESLWSDTQAASGKSCAACHGKAGESMRGVAAGFPKISSGRLMNLEERINACRITHQHLPALAYESRPLLSLAAYIGKQSAGMPISISETPQISAHIESGRQMFHQRIGQINLSCAQCHDARWGQLLAGVRIPQAHPTGYPIYRLEWQSVGSLQRRVRGCMTAVRAEPFAFGAQEIKELELYLAWRARGMTVETPAVRP